MDPFIIAAIISAVVIIILSIAFKKVSTPKPQGTLFRENNYVVLRVSCHWTCLTFKNLFFS